ncbi:MAG: hypothetical protein IV298_06925 [Cylindrospermopsis raciborskii KL1]|nr:hypothetical protein [Cylindrospermopsis raciborskii]MBG0743205.1 hypothetical protein [Cylindrospermopsis raciborskii KL1]
MNNPGYISPSRAIALEWKFFNLGENLKLFRKYVTSVLSQMVKKLINT